ncbi:TPA: hypothetical protein IHD35_000532 [Escherichia coli]|nr:hypothetical protein [Lelliottia amnigena]MCG7781044.1 hypothetical protein [Lelliottia amnigena]HAO1322213.1 hypothetical protein [Escherichia coli]
MDGKTDEDKEFESLMERTKSNAEKEERDIDEWGEILREREKSPQKQN